jgi:hypothetical protein
MSRFATFSFFLLILIASGVLATGCGRYEAASSSLTDAKDFNGSPTKTKVESEKNPSLSKGQKDQDPPARRADSSRETNTTQALVSKPCEHCHQSGRCRICVGTGLIPCLVCGTTGELDQFNPGSISNDNAPTFIKVPCQYCFGGKKTCVICKGSTMCTHCNGQRVAK